MRRKPKREGKTQYTVLPPRRPSNDEVYSMAATVLEVMGGPKGAADKLSWENFYVLAYLAACAPQPEKDR